MTTNLQNCCSLPIEYDDFEDKVKFCEGIKCRRRNNINIEDIHPTLLNKSVSYPQSVYEEYNIHMSQDDTIFSSTDLNYDILVIPSGLLGIEFVKSHIYYTPPNPNNAEQIKFSAVIEAIKGTVTVIMQKNDFFESAFDDQPAVERGVMTKLKPGQKIAIPEGYYYTFVNNTEETTILSRVYRHYDRLNYQPNSKKCSMAYYCIRKNARCEFVFSPDYKYIPEIENEAPEDNHAPGLGLDKNESLYNLVKTETEMFMNILA